MKVALFVPCYVDAFFPEVAIATLQLLERLGCSVAYPLEQTCCGQPMANGGCQTDAAATEAHFVGASRNSTWSWDRRAVVSTTSDSTWTPWSKRLRSKKCGPQHESSSSSCTMI